MVAALTGAGLGCCGTTLGGAGTLGCGAATLVGAGVGTAFGSLLISASG